MSEGLVQPGEDERVLVVFERQRAISRDNVHVQGMSIKEGQNGLVDVAKPVSISQGWVGVVHGDVAVLIVEPNHSRGAIRVGEL